MPKSLVHVLVRIGVIATPIIVGGVTDYLSNLKTGAAVGGAVVLLVREVDKSIVEPWLAKKAAAS